MERAWQVTSLCVLMLPGQRLVGQPGRPKSRLENMHMLFLRAEFEGPLCSLHSKCFACFRPPYLLPQEA